MIEGNYILESLKKANESHKKIYIYGCSLMGKIVSKRLDYEGIEYEAFVVDAEYATS